MINWKKLQALIEMASSTNGFAFKYLPVFSLHRGFYSRETPCQYLQSSTKLFYSQRFIFPFFLLFSPFPPQTQTQTPTCFLSHLKKWLVHSIGIDLLYRQDKFIFHFLEFFTVGGKYIFVPDRRFCTARL